MSLFGQSTRYFYCPFANPSGFSQALSALPPLDSNKRSLRFHLGHRLQHLKTMQVHPRVLHPSHSVLRQLPRLLSQRRTTRRPSLAASDNSNSSSSNLLLAHPRSSETIISNNSSPNLHLVDLVVSVRVPRLLLPLRRVLEVHRSLGNLHHSSNNPSSSNSSNSQPIYFQA